MKIRWKLLVIVLVLLLSATMCAGECIAQKKLICPTGYILTECKVVLKDGAKVIKEGMMAKYLVYGSEYISLNDLCRLLSDTEKQMDVSYESGINNERYKTAVTLEFGINYGIRQERKIPDKTKINGREEVRFLLKKKDGTSEIKQYDVYLLSGSAGTEDVYIKLFDVGKYLGINFDCIDDNSLCVDLGKAFKINPEKLKFDGYFDIQHSVLVGDESEKIFYGKNINEEVAMASTTKLMTLLLTIETIKSGKLGLWEDVQISEKSFAISTTEDAENICYRSWEKDKKVTVHDLIAGMMLNSSNECAELLAETVASRYYPQLKEPELEAAFVKLMNERAVQLQLKAHFLNPHGLPQYSVGQQPTKMSNTVSAESMFSLALYLLKNHRTEVTYFTAKPEMRLKSFEDSKTGEIYAKSTYQQLIYNEDVIGLKTGTTTRAGSCIVAAKEFGKNPKHTAIAIVYGADSREDAFEAATVLFQIAENYYKKAER